VGAGCGDVGELTALAAIEQGMYAQAFPSFGPERRGAPVMAFVRVSDTPIRTREKDLHSRHCAGPGPESAAHCQCGGGAQGRWSGDLEYQESAAEIRQETGIPARLALVDATTIAMETMRIPSPTPPCWELC